MRSPAAIIQKVLTTIERVGSIGVVDTSSGGDYDVDEAEVVGDTAASVSVMMSPPVDYRKVYRSQASSLKSASSIVYVGVHAALTPAQGMTFTLCGATWKIQTVKPFYLKGTLLAYELEVSLG